MCLVGNTYYTEVCVFSKMYAALKLLDIWSYFTVTLVKTSRMSCTNTIQPFTICDIASSSKEKSTKAATRAFTLFVLSASLNSRYLLRVTYLYAQHCNLLTYATCFQTSVFLQSSISCYLHCFSKQRQTLSCSRAMPNICSCTLRKPTSSPVWFWCFGTYHLYCPTLSDMPTLEVSS